MQEDNLEIAILAGGCFWCTEAVFQRVQGVVTIQSGFTGGTVKNPAYREVTTQRTGHAEAIEIQFDPEQIMYRDLLEIFFATHDPTTLNRQGADKGTHYRSAIFYTSESQMTIAEVLIAELEEEKVFDAPIVTQLEEAGPFYKAEEYHKNYYNQNSQEGYCQFVISPKLKKLKQKFQEKLKVSPV